MEPLQDRVKTLEGELEKVQVRMAAMQAALAALITTHPHFVNFQRHLIQQGQAAAAAHSFSTPQEETFSAFLDTLHQLPAAAPHANAAWQQLLRGDSTRSGE